MKILEVIPLLSVDGGAESFVVYFCNELIRQGHECTILTLFSVPDDVIRKIGLDSRVELYSTNKNHGFDPICSIKVLSAIKRYRPDIVHAHVGAIPYIALSTLCYHSCRYYATIHSEAKREAGRGYSNLIRKVIFRSNRVTPVTISEQSYESFVDYYGFKPKLVYNGVPSFALHVNKQKNTDRLTFIHVARCHPIKNQRLLLEAFTYITQKYDNVFLHWYGTNRGDELFDSLKQYFSSHVIYHGSVPDCRKEMVNADAFCLSSIMEGMPMTIIEALSVGCIPLVTPVGGCINMVKDSVNGFLSDDLSLSSYIEMVEKFIGLSDSEKDRMSKNARDSFDNLFSIKNTVTNYIKLFVE